MRTWHAVSVVCLLASMCRADDQTELRAVVDRAIKARGGRELLSKYKAYRVKDKGTLHAVGSAIPYTAAYTFQGIDQHRLALEGEVNGQKVTFVKVLNKDKGWFGIMGMTQEMDKEKLAEEREQTYAIWMATLVPLQDRAFTLAPAGEIQVDDQPAVGVRVSRAGHRDVTLYFDRKTHFLVKTETRIKGENGMEITAETFYSDHKGESGKQAYKMVIKHDGKLHLESETTEYMALEQAEEETFDKP